MKRGVKGIGVVEANCDVVVVVLAWGLGCDAFTAAISKAEGVLFLGDNELFVIACWSSLPRLLLPFHNLVRGFGFELEKGYEGEWVVDTSRTRFQRRAKSGNCSACWHIGW